MLFTSSVYVPCFDNLLLIVSDVFHEKYALMFTLQYGFTMFSMSRSHASFALHEVVHYLLELEVQENKVLQNLLLS